MTLDEYNMLIPKFNASKYSGVSFLIPISTTSVPALEKGTLTDVQLGSHSRSSHSKSKWRDLKLGFC